MTVPVPYELAHLLDHLAPSARDEAWTAFVQANSKLILYVARSLGGDHDDVMDRYACVLEQLRRDDFHRLRAYGADGRGKFTTWLVVVVRRICLDHQREKYGRARGNEEDVESGHRMRGRLVDLVSDGADITELVDSSASGPEEWWPGRTSVQELGGPRGYPATHAYDINNQSPAQAVGSGRGTKGSQAIVWTIP